MDTDLQRLWCGNDTEILPQRIYVVMAWDSFYRNRQTEMYKQKYEDVKQ